MTTMTAMYDIPQARCALALDDVSHIRQVAAAEIHDLRRERLGDYKSVITEVALRCATDCEIMLWGVSIDQVQFNRLTTVGVGTHRL